MQWVETHAQPYQHYSGLKGPFDPGCFTPRQIFRANWKSIVQDGKCCIEFEKKVVFIQSARNTVPSSLKTSILKKLVPIYFIRILKAVTKQSINNLEYAAFLILPVEIKFFFLSNILFFQRHLWRDHYGNKVALTFLMLSLPFQSGGVLNRFLAF